MCMALGASRGQLARGIAIEGALLALAGAVAALPVASWLFGLVQAFQLPGNVSIELLELSLDRRVLAICTGASAAAVLLIAMVAGVFGFRAAVADALRSRSGATPRVAKRGTRATLVGAQVAVAVTLLAGAGLFARSLMSALSLNTGLDMSHVVIGSVHLEAYGYSPERATEFFDTLLNRLQRASAVRSVALSRWEGGMSPAGKLVIDGLPRRFPTLVSYVRVDEHYFRTLGIRITDGRGFGRDDRADGRRVAIVSESFGRLLANGGSSLGYVLADSMATMRMREMGIRAALGATRRQLGSMVLGETARLIGIGIVAGLGLAWLAANTVRSFLFQVQPLDPLTLGSVAAGILLLALLVSLRAALRAARVDLTAVLKAE